MWHLSKKSQLKKKNVHSFFCKHILMVSVHEKKHGLWNLKCHMCWKSQIIFFWKLSRSNLPFDINTMARHPVNFWASCCFDTVLITTKVLTLHCSLAYCLANGCLPLWYYSPLVDGYFKCSFCHQSWSRMPMVFCFVLFLCYSRDSHSTWWDFMCATCIFVWVPCEIYVCNNVFSSKLLFLWK